VADVMLHRSGMPCISFLPSCLESFNFMPPSSYTVCYLLHRPTLQAELSAEERSLWPMVADSTVLDWWPYGYTMFAGVRHTQQATRRAELPCAMSTLHWHAVCAVHY
jgi:hypothetical protein